MCESSRTVETQQIKQTRLGSCSPRDEPGKEFADMRREHRLHRVAHRTVSKVTHTQAQGLGPAHYATLLRRHNAKTYTANSMISDPGSQGHGPPFVANI